MKKWLCLLCVLTLLPFALAQAETREAVIFLEGEEETITETRFDCDGFSFWYDADLYAADSSRSGSGSSVLLENKYLEGLVYMELMGPDAIGMDPWDYLEENMDPDTDCDFFETETGGSIVGFTKEFGEDGTLLAGYYIVEAGEDFAAIYSVCPIDVYEPVSAYFFRVMETVSFGDQPVRAAYADDLALEEGAYDAFVAAEEEFSVRIAFLAEEPVTDFKVLDLSMADVYSDMLFDVTEVYRQAELAPGRPLVVTMAFYGDIPNNGVSYVDADGAEHFFAVDMSGENGALILWEF